LYLFGRLHPTTKVVGFSLQFVNSSFKKKNNEILDKAPKGKKSALRKMLNKELYEIKQDLFNNTLLSDDKYHQWIATQKNKIFPENYKESYEFDVQNDPQKYMKHMIYMCSELEKIEAKSFQFFPLRTNIVPKYIPIDTASIVDLFIDNDKGKYLDDIDGYKNSLWNKIINKNRQMFNQKDFEFDYRMLTDGYAVSIQFRNKDTVEEEGERKAKLKTARQTARQLYLGKTSQEIDQIKEEKKKQEKEAKEEKKVQKKKETDKRKENFKKLSKEEQKQQRERIKQEKEQDRKNAYIEFPYLEQLNEVETANLKTANYVVTDPGKKALVTMKNKKGVVLRYTNKQHLKRTKRLKYVKLLENYKSEKTNIKEDEKVLSGYNSRSCDYGKFKAYIKKKNEVNEKLLKEYENKIFRQYKWYGYINRRRAETDLVRNISKAFGKDAIIIYGDWSKGEQMRNFISTPNLSLKRKIGEYFTIYNIDEYRTSCLNYKTHEKTENMYLPDKRGEMRKKHSILTYKMENNRKGCINRDKNAVNNMITIVEQFKEDRTRPYRFRRGKKLDTMIPLKDTNLDTFVTRISYL